MRKLYLSAFTLCTILGISAQEVVWQKDIRSSTQDFLSEVTTTIDQQYLITGSSIQSKSQPQAASSQQPAAKLWLRFSFGKTQSTGSRSLGEIFLRTKS